MCLTEHTRFHSKPTPRQNSLLSNSRVTQEPLFDIFSNLPCKELATLVKEHAINIPEIPSRIKLLPK
jgi:hypothetical protein